ncbi:hypothetical protein [Pedobacter heparinus]|uniref:hypothetical protein n=1 Tax=Pedobacter heparinus TaxID=984 RepID=UPI00292D857C|nr:hypothetical protein [Pedobacter heparinus]
MLAEQQKATAVLTGAGFTADLFLFLKLKNIKAIPITKKKTAIFLKLDFIMRNVPLGKNRIYIIVFLIIERLLPVTTTATS